MAGPTAGTTDSRAAATAARATALAAVCLLVAAGAAVALTGVGPLVGADGTGGPGPDGTSTASDDPATGGEWPVVTDVAGESRVTVTYATANGTAQFTVDGVDPETVDGEADWAYLPRAALPAALERVAGNHTAGVVTVGQWALVGDLAASVRETVPVTVVAPAGMAVDPGQKAHFLVEFLSPYALGGPSARPASERVTFLVAPDALPSNGRMYDHTGYVTQHAFWDGDVGSVWIHEYVHARRAFALEPEMRWFSEASATYLSYRVMEAQYGKVTESDIVERLAAESEFEDVALATRAAWDDTRADYTRGARLLYAVDAAVRSGSDGSHTLVDVFRALNRRAEEDADEGPVSVDEFVRVVERHSGADEDWLRAAITETGDLSRRVANASTVFENGRNRTVSGKR